MPNQIFELFGKPLSDTSEETEQIRKQANCPFTNSNCDGGGNRHQTTIKLENEVAELKNYFAGLENVVPGICSIKSERETWLVCPRRLFGVKKGKTNLLPHEFEVLRGMGLPQGVELGIWSEVNLNYKEEESSFNYHFDYVIAPINNIPLEDLADRFQKDRPYWKMLSARANDGILEVPDLSKLVIVEVMTASTSGSNTANETDIRSAFKKAVLGKAHSAPGINKRQVWGRMATQLFAKSACAEYWGGKTYWLLQDQFLSEIEGTTRLSTQLISQSTPTSSNNVNMMIFRIDSITGDTVYSREVSGLAGLSFNATDHLYTGILLPKKVPGQNELLKAMLRKLILMKVSL